MGVAAQHIRAGKLEPEWKKELARLAEIRAIERIWKKDASLWKTDEAHGKVIRNRLGWLNPNVMSQQAAEVAQFAQQTYADGFRDIVLLGMGGSSLAPEVFSLVFPSTLRFQKFWVIDSTDPASLKAVEKNSDLRKCLFIVASKSGKTIETLSQFRYFHEKVRQAGVNPPGSNFIAITDAGSFLDQQAQEQKFRKIFRNPEDIGGRYSAISLFGLVPAALWGIAPATNMSSAEAMRKICFPDNFQVAGNPAAELGALMGVAAKYGMDKMLLLTSERLAPLGNWIEQLVAESTGKEGHGVIPVAGEIAGAPDVYGDDCYAVTIALHGEDVRPAVGLAMALEMRGAPVVEIALNEPEQLGGEFFRWEVATAVAGAVLGVNPFDEPNVTESKDATARILSDFESSGAMQTGEAVYGDADFDIFSSGANGRNAKAQDFLSTIVPEFQHKPGDYLAILAYVDRNAEIQKLLRAIRFHLRDTLRMPVLLGFGPRFLHSIGQLFKGGPAKGMFLQITCADAEDMMVPGAKYSFGQLKMAQALGDLESLVKRGKPAARLHLKKGAVAGLRQYAKLIGAI